jgi:hypothetical protein
MVELPSFYVKHAPPHDVYLQKYMGSSPHEITTITMCDALWRASCEYFTTAFVGHLSVDWGGSQTTKFVKVFSLKRFPLYGSV